VQLAPGSHRLTHVDHQSGCDLDAVKMLLAQGSVQFSIQVRVHCSLEGLFESHNIHDKVVQHELCCRLRSDSGQLSNEVREHCSILQQRISKLLNSC
jgi:hypothetical protein